MNHPNVGESGVLIISSGLCGLLGKHWCCRGRGSGRCVDHVAIHLVIFIAPRQLRAKHEGRVALGGIESSVVVGENGNILSGVVATVFQRKRLINRVTIVMFRRQFSY